MVLIFLVVFVDINNKPKIINGNDVRAKSKARTKTAKLNQLD